ncbi:hypothetical protein [Pseudomonas fluorescens]|uniref:Uncharacterized protein n=1 Tax=Pseudomonas fluorescens TaxID=294 RepID=A0A5E7QBU6_PSEFL|nr:hypothetical protein [Pseudomonas fluorescens]VVP59712.1 hypothetical protein PS880_06062 [Pseudomonas fluorescens]
MRKFKLSKSQTFCLALAVIGLTLAVLGGRTYQWILIPISIGICMPFNALVNTGRFTYFPPLKHNEVATPKTKQLTLSTKQDREQKTFDTKQKNYDLRDIPYPPKRRGDQPITNLPYGNGLSPQKAATMASSPPVRLTSHEIAHSTWHLQIRTTNRDNSSTFHQRRPHFYTRA